MDAVLTRSRDLKQVAPRKVAALLRVLMTMAAVALALGARAEKSVNLAWDPSPTSSVVGYTIQYGTNSGQYSEFLLLGDATTATVPDLLEGFTYYFVVTAHTDEGLESDPSNELAYTVPSGSQIYLPPALNFIADVILDEDGGTQHLDLVGLSPGLTTSDLTVTAVSNNPNLVPDPTVTLSASGGYLTFAPLPDAFGSATITVTVNNLQPVNNLLVRTFTVTVYSVNDAPTLSGLGDLTLDSNAGPQLLTLRGIGTGAANESQLLSITAESSEPDIVLPPVVDYSSPNSEGTLRLEPVPFTNGSSIITVTVSDGQLTAVRSFRVTVNQQEVTYFLEAESGDVQLPMVVLASTNASNGRFVFSQSSEQGDVTFHLNAEVTGNYVVWCRILSVSTSSDSFYISLDGGPESIYHTAENIWSKTWQWTRINSSNATSALFFPLVSGPHTIKFRAREASTMLDSIYVSNDLDFVPVHLSLARTRSQPQVFDVTFQSAAGYRYALDATSDFKNWSTLWSVPTNMPVAQVITYHDEYRGLGRRFYRVRVNP